MPTIRERITDLIYPRKRFNADMQRIVERDARIDELAESVRLLVRSQQEQWIDPMTSVEFVAKLQEQGYGSGYLLDLVDQIGWEEIGASGAVIRKGERERVAMDSRRQWIYNPLYQWSVWVWTNLAFGQQVIVVPTDIDAVETWIEFWEADRNDPVLAADKIQNSSNDTLVDGNLYWAYHASDQDGQTTITDIDPDEIVEVLGHPRNSRFHVFYKRTFTDIDGDQTWYYPSWMARSTGIIDKPFDNTGRTVAEALRVPPEKRTDLMATDADTVGERAFAGTVSVIQPIHWNVKDKKDPLGWPLSSAAGPWLRSHRQFASHRLTVSAAKAMFVRRKTVKSGSRGVAAVINTVASTINRNRYLDSNPPAAAGSVEVENTAVDTEDLPMSTGAGDAKIDNELFSWMAFIGLGIFPHYGGLDNSFRLATTKTMEKPLAAQWNRYQEFWTQQFKRMVRIVLEFSNEFGGTAFETGATITMDRLTEIDLDGASSGIGRMFSDVFQPALDAGLMDAETYAALVNFMVNYTLEALGGNDLAEQIQVDRAKRKEEDGDAQDGEPEQQEEMNAMGKILTEAMGNYLEGSAGLEETIAFLAGVLAEQGE